MLNYSRANEKGKRIKAGSPGEGGPPSVSMGVGVPREAGGDNAGLLTCHNGTFLGAHKREARATFWLGGSLMAVRRGSVKIDCKGKPSKRGVITGFTKGSRRRLMRMIAKLKANEKPLWVALTFPDEFFENRENGAEIKNCLRRFGARFRRKFPNGSFIWRLEMEQRKSGKYPGHYFPHFHVLVYGVQLRDLRDWMPRAWWGACGKLSLDHLKAGTYSKSLDDRKNVFSYVSKYQAKVSGKQCIKLGRVWGVCLPENLPWAKEIRMMIGEKEAVQLIRYMRRYAHIHGRDMVSLTIFASDPDFWFYQLDRLLYPR
jgi:hypothetical protein